MAHFFKKIVLHACKGNQRYSFESNTVSYEIVPGSNKIFIELWHQLPIAGSCSNRSHKVLKMRIGGDLANILKYFRRKGQKCN